MGQAERARGVVHIHSAFSADGCLQIDEIATRCIERGLSFAILADHAEDVGEAAMRRLVAACESQCREGFAIIPGLEHRLTERIHILAFGQRRIVTANSTIEMLEAISVDNCVLVAAHCNFDSNLSARLLEILAAVEIWNVSRHTRFLPTRCSLAAYRRWASAYPNLFAIGGLDMHSGGEWGCEVVLDRNCEITPDFVLAELKAGRFCTRGKLVSFDSRPTSGVRDVVFAAGDVLAGIRDVRDRALF